MDSRTILDTKGAEQLVGMGDMLFSSGSDIIRLQCPFVDTPEIERICEQIGNQRGYVSAYLLPEYIDENEKQIADIDLPIEIRYLKMPQGLLLHLKLVVHHYCKEN